MKDYIASTSRRMPEWAAKNTVWGRGKGPVPGCPLAWEDNPEPRVWSPDVPEADESPEPFTRVREPDGL